MIHRPSDMGSFQFVVLAALRAKQLTRGCVPRVKGHHKVAVMAQLEVAEGRVTALEAVSSDVAIDPDPVA